MPKPLSPEQVEILQASGALSPPEAHVSEAHQRPEPGAVFRALGNTGLPHMEVVELIDESDSTTGVTVEAGDPGSFREQLNTAHNTTNQLLGLVGETIHTLDSTEAAEARITFDLYERLGLEPDVFITPTNRPLVFWKRLFEAVRNSPLNPDQGGKEMLRNSGLFVADNVAEAWNGLVGYSGNFRVDVLSGADRPHITSVTPYGYQDGKNETPHDGLNDLLKELGMPLVADRSGRKARNSVPLTQPDCLPRVDTYAMAQLNRILSGQDPVDASTWSWLKGELSGGDVPFGYWGPGNGQVYLYWVDPGNLYGYAGVRPSGRG